MKNLSKKNQGWNSIKSHKIGQKQGLMADCGSPVTLLGIIQMMTILDMRFKMTISQEPVASIFCPEHKENKLLWNIGSHPETTQYKIQNTTNYTVNILQDKCWQF